MTTQSTAAPVRTSVTVEAPVQRAFEVFTQEMRSWWPEDHHLLDGELGDMIFGKGGGGRIFGRGTGGGGGPLGRGVGFGPAGGVGFSWDISPAWELESDPDRASEVEVRFVAESDSRTRVDLEHRHL